MVTLDTSTDDAPEEESSHSSAAARIAVIGCGWWAQGWQVCTKRCGSCQTGFLHLPHLANNQDVYIAAVVDPTPNPVSTLSSSPLLSLEELSKKYDCPFYTSVQELLADPEVGPTIDGAIVATSHASHFDVGMALLKEGIRRRRMAEAIEKEEEGTSKVGKKRRRMMEASGGTDGSGSPQCQIAKPHRILHRALHILMEKPMTTNVEEARRLWEMSSKRYPEGAFIINHTASYRPQTKIAQRIVTSNELGKIRHISASMNGGLMWLFDDPSNQSWVSKTPWATNDKSSSGEVQSNHNKPPMTGNGYTWGQIAHVLAWIYGVLGVGMTSSGSNTDSETHGVAIPTKVYCNMTHSDKTGADISFASVITCRDGTTFSLSGTALLPGSQYTDPPVGKQIRVELFGTKGSLMYGGDDKLPDSGRLELRRTEKGAKLEYPCSKELSPDFLTETGDTATQGEKLIDGFYFEDGDQAGTGPGSMKAFLDCCRVSAMAFAQSMAALEEDCAASISGTSSVCDSTNGGETPASTYGAIVEKSGVSAVSGFSGDSCERNDSKQSMINDSLVGLRTVQIIDAMYRSAISGKAEPVT